MTNYYFNGVSGGQVSWVRAIRLVRIFRVLRLSRHSHSIQLVFVVLSTSINGLMMLLLPFAMIVVLFSTGIYFFEVSAMNWDSTRRQWINSYNEEGEIQSVLDAIWLTMTTITTVGFGDVVPVTVGGKILASIVALIGVLFLSFPNIILGGNLQFAFKTYYVVRARKKLGRRFRKVFYAVLFVSELRARRNRSIAAMMDEEMEIEKHGGKASENGLDGRACDLEQGPSGDPPGTVHPDSLASPSLMLPVRRRGNVSVADPPGESSCGVAPTSEEMQTRTPRGHRDPQSSAAHSAPAVPSGQSPGSTKESRRIATNYLAKEGELNFYRLPYLPLVTRENVMSWELRGIPAVIILRRLLVRCSGCGTVEELYYSFTQTDLFFSSVDIALVSLYLMQAGYLNVFVFRRGATNMLLCLTQQACRELLLYDEQYTVDCIRSIDVAKLLWRRTTQTAPAYSVQQLLTIYHHWASSERLVDNALHTPNVDMKVTFWQMDKKGLRRTSSSNWMRSRRPGTTGASCDLQTAKLRMKEVLEKQQRRIDELKQQLSDLLLK
jgi:hypothetical protein